MKTLLKYIIGLIVVLSIARSAGIAVANMVDQVKVYLPAITQRIPEDAYQIDETKCGVQFEKHWVCYEPYPGKDAKVVVFHKQVWDRAKMEEHLLNSEVESLWAEWGGLLVETCYGKGLTDCTAQMYNLR